MALIEQSKERRIRITVINPCWPTARIVEKAWRPLVVGCLAAPLAEPFTHLREIIIDVLRSIAHERFGSQSCTANEQTDDEYEDDNKEQ